MAIPKLAMIRLSPYRYSCNLCGRSGFQRVYLGTGSDELAVCLKCLQAAVSLLEAQQPSLKSAGGPG